MSTRSSSRLLIDDKPLLILPRLACRIGLNEAVVLQQLHFHLRRVQDVACLSASHCRDGVWYVDRTLAQWQEQDFPFWSVDTIRRTFRKLVDAGLVAIAAINAREYDQTRWYTILYDGLAALEGSHSRDSSSQLRDSSSADCATQPVQTALVDVCRLHTSLVTERSTERSTESFRDSVSKCSGSIETGDDSDESLYRESGRFAESEKESLLVDTRTPDDADLSTSTTSAVQAQQDRDTDSASSPRSAVPSRESAQSPKPTWSIQPYTARGHLTRAMRERIEAEVRAHRQADVHGASAARNLSGQSLREDNDA